MSHASQFKKSWNVEENGGKQCWQEVSGHPDPGVVGLLQGSVDDWSVKDKCKDKVFSDFTQSECAMFSAKFLSAGIRDYCELKYQEREEIYFLD